MPYMKRQEYEKQQASKEHNRKFATELMNQMTRFTFNEQGLEAAQKMLRQGSDPDEAVEMMVKFYRWNRAKAETYVINEMILQGI